MSNIVAVVLGAVVLVLLLLVVVVHLVVGFSSRQWSMLLFGVVLIGFVGYNLWRLAQRGLQMRRLALKGVVGIAYVEGKNALRSTRGGKRYRLTYCYTAAEGQTFRHTPDVTGDLWLSLNLGDPVRIVYLIENPHISALEEDVQKMRQALQDVRN